MEIWTEIKDFEGLYWVSTWGRVKNSRDQIITQYDNYKGYPKVHLFKKGKRYKKRVNRLVAEAFIENSENLPQVDHMDGNKHNNSVTNLRWVTNEQNARYAMMLRNGVMDL